MNLSFFKICCKITAVGNVIAAVIAMLFHDQHLAMHYGEVPLSPAFMLFYKGFWVMVLMLGVGYWALSKRPFELRIIALVGGIVKLFLATAWIYLYMMGEAKPMIWASIIYDAFFGIVLLWFYFWSHGKTEAN